jgi:transposase
MTREELRAVYRAGEEAVIALVEGMQAQIDRLTERVQTLEGRLALNSHNSSKPPSTDPPQQRTKSLREKSGKAPGGQKGHEGHTLTMREDPDTILPHRPSHCGGCGASLEAGAVINVARRQVFELPPLSLEVVEHQAFTLRCPHCQEQTTAAFPDGVTEPVQYGPRFLALGVYLHSYQLLPYARCQELLGDLLDAPLSTGTLCEAAARCALRLERTEEQIKEGLRQASLVHVDESGFSVEGARHWLHVACTESLTHYGWHKTRGQEATEAIGILPHFRGRAVHDHWKPYFLYVFCQHALCNAHHLRELVCVFEQHQQRWAKEMGKLLLSLRRRVERARAGGARSLSPPWLERYLKRYHRLVEEGLALNPPPPEPEGKKGRKKQGKVRSLLLRLKERWRETLCFAYDFAVPFDNNQAERDVRMLKVQQKISGCFRSGEGATQFCRIRSYLSTMRKQGHGMLEALHQAFLGHPLQPCLQA